MTPYYIDQHGNHLGAFNVDPPEGAIEVPFPTSVRQVWDGEKWGEVVRTTEEVEALRLAAYADPVTGSDRHFAEAVRLQAMAAPQAEIDAAKAAGVARYEAIQAEYPWP